MPTKCNENVYFISQKDNQNHVHATIDKQQQNVEIAFCDAQHQQLR